MGFSLVVDHSLLVMCDRGFSRVVEHSLLVMCDMGFSRAVENLLLMMCDRGFSRVVEHSLLVMCDMGFSRAVENLLLMMCDMGFSRAVDKLGYTSGQKNRLNVYFLNILGLSRKLSVKVRFFLRFLWLKHTNLVRSKSYFRCKHCQKNITSF